MPNTMGVTSEREFFPQEVVIQKEDHEVDLLMQKIFNVKSNLIASRKKRDQIHEDQVVMSNEFSLLEKNWNNMEIVVAEEKKKIENIVETMAHNNSEIASSQKRMKEIYNELMVEFPVVEKEQDEMSSKSEKIEKNQEVNEQKAKDIREGFEIVKQNHVEIAQKADQIKIQANLIKDDHLAISLQARAFEEKDRLLQEKVNSLLAPKEAQLKANFLSTLVLKIIEFSTTFFALTVSAIFGREFNLMKWKALLLPRTDGLNESIGLIFLGALSYTVLRSKILTLSIVGLGLSLFYYQWRKLQNG